MTGHRSGLNEKGKSNRAPEQLDELKEKIARLQQEIRQLREDQTRAAAKHDFYENIFNATNDGIFVHALDSAAILNVNAAVSRMYGYSKKELLKKTIADLSSAEGAYTNRNAIQRIQKTMREGPQSFDWLAKKRNGNLFWVRIELKYVMLNGNQRVIALARDINEQKKAEQALFESEQRYRMLFELSPIGVTLQNENGLIVDINNAYCEATGYQKEDLFGKHISMLVPEVDKPKCKQNIARLLKGGKLEHIVWNRRKDGSFSQMFLHECRILLPDRSYGILSVAEDITKKQQIEKALQESEIRFRSIFEQNKAILLIIDPQKQKIVQANSQAEKFYGYSIKELIGMEVQRIVQLPLKERKRFLNFSLNSNGNSRVVQHKLANGKICDVEVFASPIVSGKKRYVFLIVHDVSEKRKAQQEVARLANVVEQSVEDVIITDTDGTMLYVNASFTKTTGYSKQEAIGQNPRILKSGKQETAFYEELWKTISQGKKWQGLFINKRKDGSLYYEKAVIFPIKDEQNRIVNYVGLLRDISYEKRLEEEIQQMQKLEAIGTLAGGVAHDFNNLLTVINGHAELALMRIPTDNKAHRDIISILSAGKRAQKLTNQLLAFSRKQIHELKIVNLNEVISDLEKMMRQLIKEDIDMKMKLEPDLPYVKADAGQIEQVLINLIINARDAINEKSPKEKLRRILLSTSLIKVDKKFMKTHPGSMSGHFVVIKVSDSGIGMDDETLNRIFDPFFTTKEVGKGTGLGLSTVYGIVKQNKCWIDVESKKGQGTIFKIYWPVTSEKPENPVSEKNVLQIPSGQAKIILVEDNREVRNFAASALEELGYEVLTAQHGKEALDMMLKNSFTVDLMVTDLVMPGMNGQELAAVITRANPKIHVIYVSGYTYQHLMREGSLQEGLNFIQKPYSIRDLALMIKNLLNK